jgi:ATP-binding cassette subfamily B protein
LDLVGLFALELAGPWMLTSSVRGPVQAARDLRDAHGPQAGISSEIRVLALWAAAYLGVVLAAALFRYWETDTLTRAGQAVIHDLRTKLFAHIQRLDLAWFDRQRTGALVTRCTHDIENLNELFTSGLVVLLFDAVRVLAVLVLLFWVDARLGLVVLALTPLLVGVSLVFRGGARRAHRLVRSRLARMNGYLQEVLSGIRVVQVFRREKRVSARYAGLLDEYLQANMRTIFLFALFFPIVSFVVTAMQGSILWSGGASIAAGELDPATFLLFWFWLQLFVNPIREIGERYNVLQSAFASAERIFTIFDAHPSLAQPARPMLLAQPFRAHVRFEHVSFGYGDGRTVLEDLSFEIPPGETIALVGATGAGKSTIVHLLLRLHDPVRGRITIDGVDLRELDLAAYRRELGLVLQEDFLFAGTLRENIVLARDRATPEALAVALQASTASDLVARLPSGLDAPVAERGVTFSTGERELVAFARALAGDPRLVVLDEATASIDSGTEARIESATRGLLAGRSALVVAHRLSTVRHARRILVLHHGRLRESGTHEELLRMGGIYARLHELSFREPDALAAS